MKEDNKESDYNLVSKIESILDANVETCYGNGTSEYETLNLNTHDLAQLCSMAATNYYAPLLEEKDRKIAELNQKLNQEEIESDHWETQYITADAKLQVKIMQHDKLMGLLYLEFSRHKEYPHKLTSFQLDSKWQEYKQQNGL